MQKGRLSVAFGVLVAVSAVLCVLYVTQSEEQADRPNILFITLDTTRADRLGCYGNTEVTSPALDAVAAEGIVFRNAFSVQPVTLPSHASIFTGSYPYRHGVRDNNVFRLGEKSETLAEVLSRFGYITAAFVSCFILDAEFGLKQGFSHYDDQFDKTETESRLPAERRAGETTERFCDWMAAHNKQLTKRPFFVWLHYFDPHADYLPPSPYRERYEDPYSGEIAYMDSMIGKAVRYLKNTGQWDNTLVVVVADHGESLGEHGEQTHGFFIYRSTMHVPLIIKYPDNAFAGTAVKEPVSTVDIMPTVLEILSVRGTAAYDGISLVPLMKGHAGAESRAVYGESYFPRKFGWSELRGIRYGDCFYIEAPEPELYKEDEYHNSIDTFPEQADSMKSALDTMTGNAAVSAAQRVSLDDTMVEKLEALGYLSTGEQGEYGTDNISRPDPKDMLGLYNAYMDIVSGMIDRGKYRPAAQELEALLEQDPDNPIFLLDISTMYLRLEDYGAAECFIRRALEHTQNDPDLYYMLGLCREKNGDFEEAMTSYSRAAELRKTFFHPYFRSGLLHIHNHDWHKARKAFLVANDIRPDDAPTLNNLGYLQIIINGEVEKGIEKIQEALKREPENSDILGCLGWAYYVKKDFTKSAHYLEKALRRDSDNVLFKRQLTSAYEKLSAK